MTTVFYLHGFGSHPNSNKGVLLRKAMEEKGIPYRAPALHVGPREVGDILENEVRGLDPKDIVLVGSSLGGFYTTWLAERLGCRAVLLNPAVTPWEVVGDNLGKHFIEAANVEIEVLPRHLDELKEMRVEKLKNPGNYLTFLGDRDEVLDWRAGAEFYKDTNVRIIPGADHRFSQFQDLIPEIMRFVEKQ